MWQREHACREFFLYSYDAVVTETKTVCSFRRLMLYLNVKAPPATTPCLLEPFWRISMDVWSMFHRFFGWLFNDAWLYFPCIGWISLVFFAGMLIDFLVDFSWCLASPATPLLSGSALRGLMWNEDIRLSWLEIAIRFEKGPHSVTSKI